MDDNYSSHSAIYAGRTAPPIWSQGLNLYEWVQVPGATLSSVNPENNPAINPNYPAQSPWRGNVGQPALTAYSGGCYDDSTGFYWLPLQGGHGDYGGNEPWKAQMFAESIQWQMVRNPSGAVGNAINLDDGQESTGLYSDGRLRSVHSYSYSNAANGKVYAGALIGQYPLGQSGKTWCVEIDAITGEYSLVSDYSAPSTTINNGYGASAIDPVRNAMYVTGRETARITKIDLATGAATAITPLENLFSSSGYMCAVHADGPDKILFVAGQTANTAYKAHRGLAVLNPANNTVAYPQCDNYPLFIGGAVGAVWQSAQNRLLLWDNAAETNKIAVLTPSNPADLTQPWTASVIAGTGAAPSSRASNGTYNRLQYSKRLGGIILLNATNQQFYFMRTD